MSFENLKITDSDIAAYGVQSRPNKLTGSALQNKQAFDALIAEVVKARFNALIDALRSITAAAQIGTDVAGLASTNVEDALSEIKVIADRAVAAQLTPGIVETEHLRSGAVTAEKLGGDILPEHVGIKCGTDIPTAGDISPGQIWLQYTEEE